MRRALRLAHRGDWRVAPENTVPALRAALASGACDGLEFDVRLAAGGTPVLLHDATLARIQGRPERVDELAPAELARSGIPTLAEALAVVPRRAFIDVELKGRMTTGIDDVVADLEAARGPTLDRAVASSFDADTLEALAAVRPRWPRWLNALDLSADTLGLAVRLGCSAVSVDWHAITAASMVAAGEAGLDIAAWTVRRRATATRLERLGVIALCVEAAALDG